MKDWKYWNDFEKANISFIKAIEDEKKIEKLQNKTKRTSLKTVAFYYWDEMSGITIFLDFNGTNSGMAYISTDIYDEYTYDCYSTNSYYYFDIDSSLQMNLYKDEAMSSLYRRAKILVEDSDYSVCDNRYSIKFQNLVEFENLDYFVDYSIDEATYADEIYRYVS